MLRFVVSYMVSRSSVYSFFGQRFMVSIIIFKSCFCIFFLFLFFNGAYGPRGIQVSNFSFIILSNCMFFLQALLLSIKFSFQLVFTQFLCHFLYIIFNYLQIFLYNIGGMFFSTFLYFSILLNSFTVFVRDMIKTYSQMHRTGKYS